MSDLRRRRADNPEPDGCIGWVVVLIMAWIMPTIVIRATAP